MNIEEKTPKPGMCAVSKQITIAARALTDVKDIQGPLTLKACHVLARHFVKPAARSDLSDLLAAMLLGTFQDDGKGEVTGNKRPEHWVAAVR